MSALGPEYAKYLWWKKYMTELQIVSKHKIISYMFVKQEPNLNYYKRK